jgi:hypothetical protein
MSQEAGEEKWCLKKVHLFSAHLRALIKLNYSYMFRTALYCTVRLLFRCIVGNISPDVLLALLVTKSK